MEYARPKEFGFSGILNKNNGRNGIAYMLDSTSPYREYIEQSAPDYWRNDPRLRNWSVHDWWVVMAQALLTGGVLSLLLWQIASDRSLIELAGASCAAGLAL